MDGAFVTPSNELHRRVIGILAAQVLRDPAALSAATTLESLGIDSLGLAEIIFSIEEVFDVTVPFDALDADGVTLDLRTVGTVCAAVEQLVIAQRG